jgi:CBS-domain-containing membrane protein
MKKNLVRDWMSPNLLTVEPKTSMHDAHALMKEKDVRRLPVVDDGKLVGIVTLSDVLQAEPSKATTLSIFELNYLLEKVTIDQIMTRQRPAGDGRQQRHRHHHQIRYFPRIDRGPRRGSLTD